MQGLHQTLIGNEIRRRDNDPLPRAVDERHDQSFYAGNRKIGSAREQLRDSPTTNAAMRKESSGIEYSSGLDEPVGNKHCLQREDNWSLDPDHQFSIDDARRKVGDDILRTDVADLCIDDEDFPVVAQVRARPVPA